ncbi:MAG TPA: radical SAM protein, partial [Opitutaceae bacterium]|nr:radical SAM protein [Opitutaceae bacterium]
YCAVIPRDARLRYDPDATEIDRILRELRTLGALQSLILSGGEALLSPHIDYVLAESADFVPTRYLITNGTTLGRTQKALLRRHRPRTMVSLDSLSESANAATRGGGRSVPAFNTVRWLLGEGIFTIVIMVLTRHNVPTIRDTIIGLYNAGVRNLLIQQLHCTTKRMRGGFLSALPSTRDVGELHTWLSEFTRTHADAVIDDNEVCFFHRRPSEREQKCAPSCEYLPQRMFMCGAGYNFFAIKANGDVIPCNALLDAVTGNIHATSIAEILQHSPVIEGLRALRTHRVDEIPGCAACGEVAVCDGGCRADVYNLTDEIGGPHPCCPRLSSGP